MEEWRQVPGGDLPALPGGDLRPGIQAAVLRHRGGGVESSRKDDGAGSCLDGAVGASLVLEAEALPALSPLPREQLSGHGREASPNEEESLAGDCRGVSTPVVQGVLPVLPAGGGQLVTAVTLTCDEGVLPAVQGLTKHVSGEGGQGAVQLPGAQNSAEVKPWKSPPTRASPDCWAWRTPGRRRRSILYNDHKWTGLLSQDDASSPDMAKVCTSYP